MGDFDRDEDQVGDVPEHRLTPPEHHRDDIDDELVERARPQGLAHGRGAPGDVDHAIAHLPTVPGRPPGSHQRRPAAGLRGRL